MIVDAKITGLGVHDLYILIQLHLLEFLICKVRCIHRVCHEEDRKYFWPYKEASRIRLLKWVKL